MEGERVTERKVLVADKICDGLYLSGEQHPAPPWVCDFP